MIVYMMWHNSLLSSYNEALREPYLIRNYIVNNWRIYHTIVREPVRMLFPKISSTNWRVFSVRITREPSS